MMGRGRSETLKERLWRIRPDKDWEQVVRRQWSNGRSRATFTSSDIVKEHLTLILREVQIEYPIVCSGHASITGIHAGVYTPVAAIGRDLRQIPQTPQEKVVSLVSGFLLSGAKSNVQQFKEPATLKHYVGDPNLKSKLVIKLDAGGELYGYLCLDTVSETYFPRDLELVLNELQPFISRLVAETVFSMRIWELAKPLQRYDNATLDDICNEIVNRALLTFGASGCILRIYAQNEARFVGSYYAYADSDCEDVVLELDMDGSAGERICETVIDAERYDWAVGRFGNTPADDMHGAGVSEELEELLKQLRIQAYSVFRVETRDPNSDAILKIGTLGIFHLHAKGYSWRDVALAKQLVKRAADVIALHTQNQELIRTKDELEEANELLEIEGEMSTRAEIVTLLSHDLGHKALAIEGWYEDYVSRVKRALREKRAYHSLEKETTEGETAIHALITGMNTVNKLFSSANNEISGGDVFTIYDGVRSVETTLLSALVRNNCKLEYDSNMLQHKIKGNRNIFLLVLFNLIINSIDAQKARTRRRPMTIKIACNVTQNGRLEITYSDDGPGINRSKFPDPNDIFVLGKTSKENGTGRGLTISRNLLGQFFGGGLVLQDPENAHFLISLPKPDLS